MSLIADLRKADHGPNDGTDWIEMIILEQTRRQNPFERAGGTIE